MSIQQDILDTIGEGGIGVKALRDGLGNVGANELDVAINALQRAKRVRVVNDRYEVIVSTRPLGGMYRGGRQQQSSHEQPAESFRPATVSQDSKAQISLGESLIKPHEYLGASTQPVIAERVFERVKSRRQAAVNRIAILEVELANHRSKLSECDQFLRLYERFAAGES